MDENGIVTRALVKRFGVVVAVDGLDLVVEPGELFGLLGPNGAGKTTTVGMLTTRVIPTTGTALVSGVDVVSEPALARSRLAAVTQVNTLDRSLTVWENLYCHARYFRMSRAQARRRADELLEMVRLQDRGGARVNAMSGGMAQRLMIARALVHSPRVLFLDEPTAGLDVHARLALWDQLRDLHAAGQTILLTTHYIEEADALCGRVAIMDRGRIVALDTPARLKESQGTDRVATVTLAGDAAAVQAAVERLEGVRSVSADAGILRVHATPGAGLVGALVSCVQNAGGEITDLSVADPTLETVFLALTGHGLRDDPAPAGVATGAGGGRGHGGRG